MCTIENSEVARAHVPDLDGFVIATRGDLCAIRRPGHTVDSAGVAAIGEQVVACRGIPYLNRFIRASRSNIFAIGRPCHSVHLLPHVHDRYGNVVPLLLSQIVISLSSLAEAITLPSGDHTTDVTRAGMSFDRSERDLPLVRGTNNIICIGRAFRARSGMG